MPVYKKPKPKFNKKKWSKRAKVYGRAGVQLYKDVMALKRLVNAEVKFADASISGNVLNTGGLFTLNNPPQGDTDSSRDGDSLKNQSINIRYRWQYKGEACNGRIMVLHDKQNKVSAVTDVLDSGYIGLFSSIAPKDYDKRFETQVLYDQVTQISSENPISIHNINLPLGFHTQFENGSTTVNTGALKMLYISDATTNDPNLIMMSRLQFTDN